MSAYDTYVKAFASDLRKIPVWEPGTKVELGDYGTVRNRRWEKLGNIWDLLPTAPVHLKVEDSSKLDEMSLGSAEVVGAGANSGVTTPGADLEISIKFRDGHSTFLRAFQCENKSFRRIQQLAEHICSNTDWNEQWAFVSGIQFAKQFLVLISSESEGLVRVGAKTTDLMSQFMSGRVKVNGSIEFSGTDVLKFVGRTGPISMDLTRIRGPWLLARRAKPLKIDFAEGRKFGSGAVFVETLVPEEFDTIPPRSERLSG